MADKRWKAVERRVAKVFGTRRRRGSGCDVETGSDDILHDSLHVEIKTSKRPYGVIKVYDHAAKKAKKENKTPVVIITESGSPRMFVVMPLDKADMYEVMNEIV